jgi:arginyl-tRNA synthetase
MLAEQRLAIAELIRAALVPLCATPPEVELQRPKVAAHGDLSCTVALALAKKLGRPARQIAEEVAAALRASSAGRRWIDAVEVAGPGFLNLRLTHAFKQQALGEVLRAGASYGSGREGAGRPVVVEFVSANPTGPLHLGHARQAAIGDTLANLLARRGWAVQREYYYNDAGAQIDQLTGSVQARARQLQGQAVDLAQIGYQGEYIADIARAYLAGATVSARDGSRVTAARDPADAESVRRFAVAMLRHQQDLDLDAIGVHFDHFFLESSLYADGRVEATVRALEQSGMTFEHEGALWLRTTGVPVDGATDDKDRVVRKSDGSYTYFVPDIAYHVAKFERGFGRAINIQGSDHFGTMARVRAGIQLLARTRGLPIPPRYPEYVLHKMVRVMRGGEEVKMSKRAGTSVGLRDLIDWVGRDATRFFLVSRKCDSEFTFDIDLALSHTEDNPVYYIQYAHARVCSVLAQAAEAAATQAGPALDEDSARAVDPAPLVAPRELDLLARLAEFPDVLRDAAAELAPHQVAFYLKDLAADLHAFYNAERILVDDAALRGARLALLLATRQVLRNGLALIGVSAPERMEPRAPA